MTCSTGISGRSGRPSKSAREKQMKISNADVSRNPGQSLSAVSCTQSQSIPSISSHSRDAAFESSPLWLLDWDNILQPGLLSSETSASHRDHASSGISNPQDYNLIEPFNVGRATQESSHLGPDTLDFVNLLDMTHMNALGSPQHDVMDLEVPGRGSARQSDSEIDPDIRVDRSVPRGGESSAEIREIHLEKTDLKEEVLRSLAELHSGLLADLNLMRDVGKCPCKRTARVSLASSQRNADGRTEEYNFLVGRMLNKAEIFVSILQNFTPPLPGESSSGLSGSQPESDCSDEDQDIINAFTSWHNETMPNGSDMASFEIPTSSKPLVGTSIRCDVPMMLSILTCYVCLIRIYRTIFSSIYTALVVAKERKIKLPPLFPGLKLGGFAPHMNFQVQILVQIGTNFLNKIDDALGLPDEHGRAKKGGGILEQTGSAVILQAMMKEEAVEGLENGDPSKESPREIFRKLALVC